MIADEGRFVQVNLLFSTYEPEIAGGRTLVDQEFQHQRNEWRKKGWSIPDLRGGKQNWFAIVTGIINSVESGIVTDINDVPTIVGIADVQPLSTYFSFFRGTGLLQNQAGLISLTTLGREFINDPSKEHFANIIQDKYRLFGETLNLLLSQPLTVEEIDRLLCSNYGLDWKNLSNIRRRMDWLEVLNLIEPVGGRKWIITEAGRAIIKTWRLVSPEVVESIHSDNTEGIEIPNAPAEIDSLLKELAKSPALHQKRNTYNIWVPSPNRIENLRVIIQFASERISKAELFQYIQKEFNLKVGSVDSMLPFLKASGLLEEVGRSIYTSTPAAKAWLDTGNDLDFIRILHAHMRFVGEMIDAARNDIVRNDLYSQASKYGLNTEKARWIAGFLIEAGLLEEPQYLHLKATSLGKALLSTLPISDPPQKDSPTDSNTLVEPNCEDENSVLKSRIENTIRMLINASTDPMAEGKASGVAFEEEISRVFQLMGFEARRIGGSGDTDVVVSWQDSDGKKVTAIIDGKSKSSGQVSHSDISDIAIDTHKEKNHASYVAILGPSFSGDTIRNHARKKGFALITATELSEIARATQAWGLRLQEIALLFQVISEKQRELEIITTVVSKMNKEQGDLGSLSPRDMFLLLRENPISPSLDELQHAFDVLSEKDIGVLQVASGKASPENTTYTITDGMRTVYHLRAVATAIENGLSD